MEWMELLKAFVVGGAICVVGQILIDKTKLMFSITFTDCTEINT